MQQSTRFYALDVARGCAMLAMLITHSSWRIDEFDYRVSFGWDSPYLPDLSTPQGILGLILQFATPMFFLLAGFSVALFMAGRRRQHWTEWQITRYLLIRGFVLITLDLTLFNLDLTPLAYGYRMSVLTAMGAGVWIVAAIRWLKPHWLIMMTLALLLLTQGWFYWYGRSTGDSLLRAILLAPSGNESWLVLFPILPWLPVLLLGFISGNFLAQNKIRLADYALKMGVILLITWLLVVLNNGFGNLYFDNPLIYGKHPPDLAYLACYTGFSFLLLAFYSRLEPYLTEMPWRYIGVFGQTALFFYIIHIRLLDLIGALLPLPFVPLVQSFILVGIAAPILYILCAIYRMIKRRYPTSILQYL